MWVETGKDTRKGRGTEQSQIWKSMSSLFWSIFLRGPYLSLHKPQFFLQFHTISFVIRTVFSPYFINRSDMDYLLAHTRYTATQIQEFYRWQKKLRLSLLVLWFTILKNITNWFCKYFTNKIEIEVDSEKFVPLELWTVRPPLKCTPCHVGCLI